MKSLEEVKKEIDKILSENNCIIMALYNFELEQDDAFLIRKDGAMVLEQVNLEI